MFHHIASNKNLEILNELLKHANNENRDIITQEINKPMSSEDQYSTPVYLSLPNMPLFNAIQKWSTSTIDEIYVAKRSQR